MVRRLGVLAVVVVAATVLAAVPAVAQDAVGSDAVASVVRIQARLVDSGKVEFGLQLDGDRTWLPRARLFPYQTAEIGTWLFASPYTLSDGTTVRIQARLVDSGKVEFGLQLDGDRTWLPRARLFPYRTAEVGNWLFASPYTLSDDTTAPTGDQDGQQEEDDEVPTTTTTTTKTWVYANEEFVSEFFKINSMMVDCLFDSPTGTCSVHHEEVSAEDILQAMNALFGCNWDFPNGICHDMTVEEFAELVDRLACPEGWTLVDGWGCDPEEWHES